MSEHGFTVRQEEDTLPRQPLMRVGLSAIVIATVAVLASTALLGSDQARLGGGPAERVERHGEVAPTTIGLIEQTLIEHENRAFEQQRREQARLGTYGWVNRDRGVAHIPIDRAMDLILEENGPHARDAGDKERAP